MPGMWFDTHVHLEEEDDAAALLARAGAAGGTGWLAVGGSPAMNRAARAAAAAAPDRVGLALGMDRHLAEESGAEVSAAMDALAADWAAAGEAGLRVAAVGETGLDYHYAPESAARQRSLFAAQLALAAARRLPVVVHTREADADTLALLREHAASWPGPPERIGIVHCFTGGLAFAEALLTLGFHISFSGIVTFRNADPLRAVCAAVPGDRLLLETDSPYLAPVPRRGQRNEPAFLPDVARVVAAIRGIEPERLAALTTGNADALLGPGTDPTRP